MASGTSLVFQSVRSAFDALLTAAAFPAGSEVLISGITIPDMPRIVRAHGLVPVPIDLDPATLRPDVEGAARAITARTRAVLFAHLFGGRADVDGLVALARASGLLFVEDCAQSFLGPGDWGHLDADVSMFSFGVIKTTTALGGAVLRVADRSVAARLSDVQANWPLQPRAALRSRAARLLALTAAHDPVVYGGVARAVAAAGRELDDVLAALTRGFSAADDAAFFASVRRRPCSALVRLLSHRLESFDARALDARAAAGERVAAAVGGARAVPGGRQPRRTHWLLPVSGPAPDALVAHLRSRGFDATRGASSLVAVEPAPEAPRADAPACREVMRSVVYVPGYAALGHRAERELRAALATG